MKAQAGYFDVTEDFHLLPEDIGMSYIMPGRSKSFGIGISKYKDVREWIVAPVRVLFEGTLALTSSEGNFVRL
jgi:hypothetical protein